jgi:chromosome segregation ATPase
MDKKQRQQIIFRIGDLFEHKCRPCKLGNGEHCKTCDVGKELLELGQRLDGIKEKVGDTMPELTKEAYESMKKEGRSDSDIDRYFGVKQPTIHYYKKKWYGETKDGKDSKEEKQLRQLNDELVQEIEKLKNELENLKEQLVDANSNIHLLNQKLREREAEAEYWKRQSEIARQNEVNTKQTIGTLKAALKVVL